MLQADRTFLGLGGLWGVISVAVGICSPTTSSWKKKKKPSGQHSTLSLAPSLPSSHPLSLGFMRQAPSLLGFSWKCHGSRIGGCADSGRALLATCELQLPGDFNWGWDREREREGGHADIKRLCNLKSWLCMMHILQTIRALYLFV